MATQTANIKPTSGYVLLEPFAKEEKTASGIYLPDSSDEKPQKATVLEVGDTETTDSGTKKTSPVKKGDVVIYKKWGGSEVKLNGKDYIFAKFDDILAIVK